MLRYSRSVAADAPAGSLDEARQEVRAQLSAVADSDDDPDTRADEVRIWTEHDDHAGATKVVGELDAEADAPYLREGFDPDADTEFAFVRYSEEGRE